ncbi:MAG: isochorismatase family protein [Candidatus Marinimicrobia bacterium]|nr:isochorismatase family protein [Candidatus Neomarinimicrobiota bacterium]
MEFLNRNNCVFVLVDVQENIFPAIHDKEILRNNLKKLLLGIQTLNVPIIVTEQYSKGLGVTLPELSGLLKVYEPIEKITFSCFGEEKFQHQLTGFGRNQILVAGIEAHICVYQTCRELDNNGFDVHLITDCIGSRDPKNKELAISKLQNEYNIALTTSEMLLFELLKIAGSQEFKTISQIVK